jgi:hypothetical protein
VDMPRSLHEPRGRCVPASARARKRVRRFSPGGQGYQEPKVTPVDRSRRFHPPQGNAVHDVRPGRHAPTAPAADALPSCRCATVAFMVERLKPQSSLIQQTGEWAESSRPTSRGMVGRLFETHPAPPTLSPWLAKDREAGIEFAHCEQELLAAAWVQGAVECEARVNGAAFNSVRAEGGSLCIL